MINHEEKALESIMKSHYLGLITTTACLIFICIIYITSNNYTDTQIQMFKTILSITIPVTIGLAACYFITHIKTQKQLYVRAILYTSFISILAPLSMITLNAIDIFIPVAYPWMYYLLTATLIIVFSVVEMHDYNKAIVDAPIVGTVAAHVIIVDVVPMLVPITDRINHKVLF